MKRITFLDGLRGIAILLVVCFHSFARWPKFVPYGEQYSNIAIFKFGYLGVQLFFLISGFVILMSLENSFNFYQFLFKRWLRLFPTMLIATILVYVTAQFIEGRPAGIPKFNSIIPGLLFVEPSWILLITGMKINLLEGSFWSLFVEFKFYVIFGLLYFRFGKLNAILGIFLMFLTSFIARKFNVIFLNSFSDFFSFEYFGWFAIGSLAYLYFFYKEIKYILFSILICFFEIYKYRSIRLELLSICVVLGIFMIPICFEKTRFIFTNKIFLFFGFISYPFYLIHENALILLIAKMNLYPDLITSVLLPIIPILFLSSIAYIIAKKVEPVMSKKIRLILKPSRTSV